MKLSLLIPTIDNRRQSFKELILKLTSQIIDAHAEEHVEIISLCDKGLLSIGAKRNELLQRAHGEYVAFIDDDDTVSDRYIEWGIQVAHSGKDCGSLLGIITWNGERPEKFEHSLKYGEFRTVEGSEVKYERYPIHINFIRREIVQQFKFAEINHGEDHEFARLIKEAGLIKSEFTIPEVIYYYQFKPNK